LRQHPHLDAGFFGKEMPDSLVKIGMMRTSSPELSTEVVDASRIDCNVGLSAA